MILHETITAILVDGVDPFTEPRYDDEHGHIEGYDVRAGSLPDERMVPVLQAILDAGEAEMSCAFSHLTGNGVKAACATPYLGETPIGWLLHEDDDEPHRSGIVWRAVALVATDEGVTAVCEDCHPVNLYAAAREAAEKAAS